MTTTQQYFTHWHLRLRNPSELCKQRLTERFTELHDKGKLQYAAIGEESVQYDGEPPEVHFHIPLGFSRALRKHAVINLLQLFVRDPDGRHKNGFYSYYLEPVYGSSTPRKNWDYCLKGKNVIYTAGECPRDEERKRSDTMAACRDRVCIELAKAQKFDEIEEKYPGHWIRNGARLKALYMRQSVPEDLGEKNEKHLWIYGEPGLGKTSLCEYLFPGHYKKRQDPDWLGYQPDLPEHKTVLINDLDIHGLQKISIGLLKELCDPQGFNSNKKYAGGDIINPSQIVVTSNFRIHECLKPGTIGVEQQKAALQRRFREVHISELLTEKGLQLTPPDEVQECKDRGLWTIHKYKCMFKPIGESKRMADILSE